jgi:ABC-2 type transport system ATP-binding protein
MAASISVVDLHRSYGRQRVLDGVHLMVPLGSVVGIVGENGSGKSTLLKCLVGLLKPDRGSIAASGRIGYCPQEPILVELLTCAEQFALFGAGYGLSSQQTAQRAAELMDVLGCSRYAATRVDRLSGGTRQKVNLIVSLLHDPDVLILDEPYQGFDHDTYLRFWNYAAQLRHDGRSLVVVSHMITDREHFDTILTLQDGSLVWPDDACAAPARVSRAQVSEVPTTPPGTAIATQTMIGALNGGRRSAPTRTATAMFLRELRRRWPSMLFMVLMPAAYFVAMYSTSSATEVGQVNVFTGIDYELLQVNDRTYKSMYLAVLGISVTSAFAAMTTIANRGAVIRRLRLAGYPARRLLIARFAVLLLIMAVSTAVFAVVLATLVSVNNLPLVALALLEVAVVGIGLGTLLGLLLIREFEASMIIIAICGIQMALGRSGSDAERYLPFSPSVEAMKTAAFTDSGEIWRFMAQGLGYALVLIVLSLAMWSWRMRVWRPLQDDEHSAAERTRDDGSPTMKGSTSVN